ncbi:MAG: hypothetical protein DRI46_08405 [Chloroflexi bacterium]|nr:MAG: hypothetical protein DRI46_08405 [Chloroflexota bacterium]
MADKLQPVIKIRDTYVKWSNQPATEAEYKAYHAQEAKEERAAKTAANKAAKAEAAKAKAEEK